MLFSFPGFIASQFRTLHVPDVGDLSGRVVIVTGSNTGLGLEAARILSRHDPARLILAVRNIKAGEEAARSITESNGGKCVPEVWSLDLGKLSSVKEFCDRAEKELERLDIVISNAGINTETFTRTADGFESTSQVNNISNTLLCTLLIPLLKRTAALDPLPSPTNFKPHLTIVASEVHHWINGKLPGMDEGRKDTLQCMQEEELFTKGSRGANRYPETKAINVMNCHTLSQLAGPSIIINSVNPGFCHSTLTRGIGGINGLAVAFMKLLLARKTSVGSYTLVWAGTQPTPTGAYSENCEVSEASDFVLSSQGKEIGAEIWEEMKVIYKEKVGVDADRVLS